jgi:hypothetical protein
MPAPAINASVASHGGIWITLMQTTASAANTSQGRFVTSMARGGLTFDRLPRPPHASMGRMALHVHLARLESEGGQSLGEVRHVLPRAAADLEHQSAWRQYPRKHLEDRLLIALGRGDDLTCVHVAMVGANARSQLVLLASAGAVGKLPLGANRTWY